MPEHIAVPRRAAAHRPGVLGAALGVVRLTAVLLLAAGGAVVALLSALVPARGAIRPPLRVVVGLARGFVRVMGIRVVCPDPDAIRLHRGLVFFNHLSYLDPVVLMSLGPARPLAAAGVRKLPFIGPMAASIGTVFVDRGDKASRRRTRETVVARLREQPYPPVMLAPEGQIGAEPDAVLPFRYGAFEVAIEGPFPIRPVVVRYDPFEGAVWLKGEWVLKAVWRLAARTTPFTATLTPLSEIVPVAVATEEEEDAQAAALAEAAEARFNEALGG